MVASATLGPEGVTHSVAMAVAQDCPVFPLSVGPPLALRVGQPSQSTHLLVCPSLLSHEVSKTKVRGAQSHPDLLPAWNIIESGRGTGGRGSEG